MPNLDDREPPRPIPIWGYVVINLVAAAILYGIYHFGYRPHGRSILKPYGLAPLLLFVWICFVIASIYDLVHDRVADQIRRQRDDQRRSGRTPRQNA